MAQPAGKEYDPEKSDFLHGRTVAGLRFYYGRGFDTSRFCPACGLRKAWCQCATEPRVTCVTTLEVTQ